MSIFHYIDDILENFTLRAVYFFILTIFRAYEICRKYHMIRFSLKTSASESAEEISLFS